MVFRGAFAISASLPVAALVPLGLLVAAWLGYCVLDIVRQPATRYLPKSVWAIITLVSIPFGGLVYLLAGRPLSGSGAGAWHAPEVPATSPAARAAAPVSRPIPPPAPLGAGAERRPDARPAPRGERIVATALRKMYPPGVGVDRVDLIVRDRQVLGLVGPNGAGKTTLLALLCGLRQPESGAVWRRGVLAVCPDAPGFEPWLTGREVLRQSRDLARRGVPADRARVDQVVAETGIGAYLDRRCGGYSRGMTQRLGIAAALIVEPDVLVLDEPTSALDAAGRVEMLELIACLKDRCAVIMSSHVLADVQRCADTIAVLDRGRLSYCGPTEELISRYLRPAWEIHFAVEPAAAREVLNRQTWVRDVQPIGSTGLRIETSSLAEGQRGLMHALADAGVPVTSVAPVDADLESAFLALTRARRRDHRTAR